MSDLISRQAAIDAMGCISDSICKQQAIDALWELPTIEAEPVKMMCNGGYINCPAHKDYERGYKDGQAKAQMKAEPKHGRWIEEGLVDGNQNRYCRCSECGKGDTQAISQRVPYCWWCGAKMDLNEVEE